MSQKGKKCNIKGFYLPTFLSDEKMLIFLQAVLLQKFSFSEPHVENYSQVFARNVLKAQKTLKSFSS